MLQAAHLSGHRLEFAPPLPQGTGRAFSLALLAHLLLAAALAWGVSWKREATMATVEAELWSALPQQAAPKLIEPAPSPPQPTPKVQPPPAKAPDIVTEKIKPKPEPKPEVKPQPKPEPKPEAKPVTKPQVNKAQEERKLAEQREAERSKNMERIAGMAGATGAKDAVGNATQSGSTSSGYAGLIKGRVKPNLVFTGTVSGNPQVTIELRLAPDGTILDRPRVVKSSGSKEWDEAVVRAFEKTQALPRDNGKIWSPMVIDWRVND